MDKKIILLVEDNLDDMELALRAFKKNNILNEVIVAHDGAEALDYLFGRGIYGGQSRNGTPELILLDLKLPKIDGLEVLRRLRADERTRLIPVVVLSSSTEDEQRVKAYKLDVNCCIRKPLDFNQLAEAVRQLGLSWLILNEPFPPPKEIK